jgi:hypothetical protein
LPNPFASGAEPRLPGSNASTDPVVKVASTGNNGGNATRAAHVVRRREKLGNGTFKSDPTPLGLRVHVEDQVLRIDRVAGDGAIGEYNEKNPNAALLKDDCIVAVNHVRGNSYKMLLECKEKDVLDFELRPCTPQEIGPPPTTTTSTTTATTTSTTLTFTTVTSTTTLTEACPACTPKYREALDLAIPFFERDLCKLKYTAKSISLYDPHHHLGNVYLMWVSFKPFWQYKEQIDEVLRLLRKTRLAFLLDFSELMRSTQITGWHAQQIVKLKVASKIGSSSYLVLDTKNTLIREVKADTFLMKCNQGRIQADYAGAEIPTEHLDWYRRSAKALHLQPPDKAGGYWPASVTPVVMHKQTVLDMLSYIGEQASTDKLCDGPLCEMMGAIRSHGSGAGATEFTMYTLWAYQKTKLECTHSIDVMGPATVPYGSHWRADLIHELGMRDVHGLEELEQVTIRDKSYQPLHARWLTNEINASRFPLRATDVILHWALSLWRGNPNDSGMENVNLQCLENAQKGAPNQPMMFGCQSGAMNSLDQGDWNRRQRARGKLVAVYRDANLYDPATMGSTEDLFACVVGYNA